VYILSFWADPWSVLRHGLRQREHQQPWKHQFEIHTQFLPCDIASPRPQFLLGFFQRLKILPPDTGTRILRGGHTVMIYIFVPPQRTKLCQIWSTNASVQRTICFETGMFSFAMQTNMPLQTKNASHLCDKTCT
jgi:hypothetical protein